MSPIKDLIAVSAGSKVDPDSILGFLTMYSIPDRMVDYRDVAKQWATHGLPANMPGNTNDKILPKVAKPIDTFQLACSSVATKRVRGAADEVLTQRAFLSTEECVYQITHSVRDAANKIVEHPKAMSVTFVTNGERITVERREEYDALASLEQTIRDRFKEYKGQIAGGKIRTGVRRIIVEILGGTNYMGKGIYMVPKAGLKELESIKLALHGLYGDDAHVSLIPMIDTKGNREDLARFHTDDIRERSEALIGTMAEKIREGGTVRRDMFENVVKEARALKEQRTRVLELVGNETQAVEERMKIVSDQIDKLATLMAGQRGATA